MSLISRMKSDMNPVLLSDIQKRYRWEANKNKATIGYVQMLTAKMLVLVLILMKR